MSTRRWMKHCIGAFAAVLLVGAPLAAQVGSIAGTVRTADGEPLAGAQIVVVGTGLGTLTQEDGQFLIRSVPAGEQEVRVEQIGYRNLLRTVDVPAGGVATVEFTVTVEAIGLNTIVVTMTGEQQSREISNAVATVNADHAVETAPVSSISDVLNGRSPGVTVLHSSGTVGTGASLKVRGNSSISLSNTPIIYVDGIRVDNANSLGGGVGGQEYSRLNDISPQDIATIDVLKGPAAATLYGTEAAAGVIQITTKRGIVGEPQFQFKQELGINTRDDDTRFAANVWNPQSFFGGAVPDTLYSLNLLENQSPFRDGTINKTSGSVRGGIGNFTYYLSGQHDFEEGVLPNNEAERYFGRANFDVAASEELDITVNVGFTSSDAALPDNDNNGFGYIGVGQLAFPWDNLIEVEDFNTGQPITTCGLEREIVRFVRNQFGLDWSIADYRANTGDQIGDNCGPEGRSGFFANRSFDDVASLDNTQAVERFTGSTAFTWRPADWIRNKFTVGYDQLGTRDENLIPVSPDRPFGTLSDGYKFIQNYGTKNFSLDYVGALNFDLNDSWNSSTSLGTQWFHRTVHGSWAEGRVFPAGTPTVGNAATTAGSEFYTENKSLGLFGQQQFGFQNRVFLTGGLRADDNSAFGADYALVFYPKLGASWVVSEERWFPQFGLDQLKLRGSWGQSGKQPGLFDALQRYAAASVALRGEELAGAIPANIGNPDLAPEVGQEYELGFDLSMLRGRVTAEFTYYDQVTRDAIVARDLAPSGGFPAAVFDNVGEMTNSGIELGLNITPVETQNVVWDFGFNVATNDNEITQLEAPIIFGLGANSQRHQEGSSFGSYWHPRIEISQVSDPADCGGIATADGRCAYFAQADTSYLADGVTIDNIEGVDEFLGQPTPTLEGSFTSTLRLFQNVTLSGLIDFKRGHQLFNSTEEFRCGFLGGGATGSVCEETFETQDFTDETGEVVQVPTDEALVKQYAAQQGVTAPWIEDADFARLRSISLRLAVPSRFTDQFGVGGVSIAFMGQNLATWTDYSGLDPEINFAGQTNATRAEFLTMPLNRRFVTSVTVNF